MPEILFYVFAPHCRIQQLKQLLQDTTSDSDSTSSSSASPNHSRKKKKRKEKKKEKKKHKKKKKQHKAKASDDSDADWNKAIGLGVCVLIIEAHKVCSGASALSNIHRRLPISSPGHLQICFIRHGCI